MKYMVYNRTHMNIIFLLKLALALLIAAQGPNVTPELRQQAISTAHTAIEYAVSHPGSSAAEPGSEGLGIMSKDPEPTPRVVLGPQFGCPEAEKLPEDSDLSVGFSKCD